MLTLSISLQYIEIMWGTVESLLLPTSKSSKEDAHQGQRDTWTLPGTIAIHVQGSAPNAHFRMGSSSAPDCLGSKHRNQLCCTAAASLQGCMQVLVISPWKVRLHWKLRAAYDSALHARLQRLALWVSRVLQQAHELQNYEQVADAAVPWVPESVSDVLYAVWAGSAHPRGSCTSCGLRTLQPQNTKT